jgi:hypothetical protein
MPEAFLLGLHVREQVGDGLLHDARGLDHLGQEHLAGAEQVADHVHAVHQRAFDDLQRLARRPWRASSVSSIDEVGDALDQGVLQALGDRPAAPLLVLGLLGRAVALVLGRRSPAAARWRRRGG